MILPKPPKPLTPAEVLVADKIVEGLSNVEIARALHLSKSTITFHITRIYLKYGVTNRVLFVVRYLEIRGEK